MSNQSAYLAQAAQNYDLIEFKQGVEACKNGELHSIDSTIDFTAGYAAQYEIEQQQSIGDSN